MNATQTFFVALLTILVAGIPPTLIAWANLQQSRRNAEKTDKLDLKSDTIIEKAAEIHTLTNSNLTKVTAELKSANERIALLEEHLTTIMDKQIEKNDAQT